MATRKDTEPRTIQGFHRPVRLITWPSSVDVRNVATDIDSMTVPDVEAVSKKIELIYALATSVHHRVTTVDDAEIRTGQSERGVAYPDVADPPAGDGAKGERLYD
ncbi:hypothetical protein [Rhodococcus wratislaviensis]|uniref:hypothetical protein n=1 Tax=Rhodococcus wratislaviensis TaxID=44752 RepID=UPI00365CB88B